MKDVVKYLVVAVTCFSWLVWNPEQAHGGDFSNTSTSSKLSIYYNNGKSQKTFTKTGTDWSLAGTGWTGTVSDGGDHWIVNVTDGILNGYITTSTGLEINLSGAQVGIVCTSSANAVKANGGVRICGPGMLHIDQMATYAAIYGGSGNVAITLGAVVGVNGLGVTSTAVSGTGVRILASALHVNSLGGRGIACDKGGLSIGESIVTVCSAKTALYAERTNSSIAVTASCVHLISSESSALQCGDDIFSGIGTISVANSVFCALGGGHGIQGTLFSGGSSLVFDNVVGVIAGRNCGIYAAKEIFIDGGSTKLSIAGNIAGDHTPGDTTAVDYLQGNNSSGQGIRPSSPSRGYFGVEAGNVKLFSPGVCALDCGTNAVTGGKLEIPGKATYGDFQTLFTWQGAISAAEIFMGRSLFQSDLIYSDFDIAQAFAGVLAPSAALFSLSEAKAHTGICADMFYVTGGEVAVAASVNGIHLGGCYASHGAYLTQKGGRISVEAGRIAIVDDDAVEGYVSSTAQESGIWLTGGKLTARGGLDGILTCGYVFQQGGTLEAAATGGYKAETISSNPGLRGYALSANNGFAIDGGSFVAAAGALRTTPNTSSAHNFAKVYPCDLAVSGSGVVSVTGMVPSWYGVNGLYPIGGKLRFWLPAGSASLKYGGVQYTANGTGKVVAGSNVFRTGSSSTLPPGVKKTYQVAFKANGGKGKMAKQKLTYGKAAKLRKNAFKRAGYTFLGWAKTKKGPVAYKNGAKVKNLRTDGKTTTLYAKWAKKSYTVAFKGNGGKGKMAKQKMTYGKAAKLRKNAFKRAGYTFLGWAKTPNGAVAYKNGAKVKNLRTDGKTTTLYAKWKANGKGAKKGLPQGAEVTTSDGLDGRAVFDGDEGTGWVPEGMEAGAWVVLSFAKARDVAAVEVVGENLPEEGVRVLLSEDAEEWREEVPGPARYVWVAFPEGAEGVDLREIRVVEAD